MTKIGVQQQHCIVILITIKTKNYVNKNKTKNAKRHIYTLQIQDMSKNQRLEYKNDHIAIKLWRDAPSNAKWTRMIYNQHVQNFLFQVINLLILLIMRKRIGLVSIIYYCLTLSQSPIPQYTNLFFISLEFLPLYYTALVLFGTTFRNNLEIVVLLNFIF